MPGGGEHAHVGAGFGDEHFSGDPGKPGMLVNRSRATKRLHCLLDSGIQARDVGAVGVDAIQKQSCHERMVGAESSGQRLGQRWDLLSHPPVGQFGEHRWVASALTLDPDADLRVFLIDVIEHGQHPSPPEPRHLRGVDEPGEAGKDR